MLVDGPHSVSLVNCSTGTSIDFAIVEVGTKTNLTQSTIIVDNVSPSILYSGDWSRDNSILERGFPYGNSTQRSSTPGDSFTFSFTGALPWLSFLKKINQILSQEHLFQYMGHYPRV
jgi:hypothetical protein